MADTTVNVETLWKLRDEASAGMRGMDAHAKSLSGTLSGVQAVLGSIAAVGLGAMVKATVDANSKLEETRFQLAGLMQSAQNFGTLDLGLSNFSDVQKKAGDVYSQLRKDAAVLPGETADYVAQLNQLYLPMAKAGVGLEGILKFSKQMVPASIMAGIQGEVAARDISQALMGLSSERDVMIKKLNLEPEHMRAIWKTQGPQGVIAEITAAMNKMVTPEMMEAAGENLTSKLGTAKDQLQKIKEMIGEGLFKATKKQLDEMSRWYDAHQAEIQTWATEFSTGLVTGANAMKDAMMWVADNKDTLIKVAEALLVLKGMSVAGGLLGLGGGATAAGSLATMNPATIAAMATIGTGVYLTMETSRAKANLAMSKGAFDTAVQKYNEEATAGRAAGATSRPNLNMPSIPMEYETYGEMNLAAKQLRDYATQLNAGTADLNAWTTAWKESATAQTNILLGIIKNVNPEQSVSEKPQTLEEWKWVKYLQSKKPGTIRVDKVEIKVDAKGLNPNQVANEVVAALGHAATRPVQPKGAYSRTRGGR